MDKHSQHGRHRLGRPGLHHARHFTGTRGVLAHRHAAAPTPSRGTAGLAQLRRTTALVVAHLAVSVAGVRRHLAEAHAGRRRSPARVVSLVAAFTALSAVAVSGWYTASGASAIAQMLAR